MLLEADTKAVPLRRFSRFIRRSTTVRITAAKPAMQSTFRLRSQSTQAAAAALSRKQPSEKLKDVKSRAVDVSHFFQLHQPAHAAEQAPSCAIAWPFWLWLFARLMMP